MKIHLIVIVMLVFTSLFVLIPLEKQSVSAGWYGSGYTYRVQITIDKTKVENHLVWFPMLFNYTSVGFKNHAQADGDDFVFCLNSTGAKLPHEIETYDSSTGYLRAWVNVTGINHATTVIVDLYYGNATTSSNQNKNGVWNANYFMVQHLDDTLYEDDSTSNTKDMVHSGTDIVAGKIGNAEYFNVAGDYVRANATFSALTTVTFEQWVKFNSADGGSNDGILTIRVNDPALFRYSNESLYVYEDGAEFGSTGAIVGDTNWHYIVLSFDGTNGNLYCDKVKVKSKAATTSTGITNVFYYGDNGLGTDTFTGVIDEGRISNIARNWSWINTSYNNVNSPSTFYSVGAQTPIDPITPSAPVYFEALSQNSSWIRLNWTHGTVGVDKTVIRGNIGSYPTLTLGYTIYNGTLHGYDHVGLTNNTHWFYRCYAWNSTSIGCYNATSLRSHDTTKGSILPRVFVNTNLSNTTGFYSQEYGYNTSYIENITIECTLYSDLSGQMQDGNYSTFGNIPYGNAVLCMIYEKPANFFNITWCVRDYIGYHNFTLTPAELALNATHLNLDICYSADEEYIDYSIWDYFDPGFTGSQIDLGIFFGAGSSFYEESLIYNFSSFGLFINFTSESRLNLTFNLSHATETHNSIWNSASGFWDIVLNVTGNASGIVAVNNFGGTMDYQWRPLLGANGEWWVWANGTLVRYLNSNLSVINPNPGNGTHSKNFLKKDNTGVTTSVDVTCRNFTDPPMLIPGDYSLEFDSSMRSNGAMLQNNSAVYNTAYMEQHGQIVTGPLTCGQFQSGGDYWIVRSYLMFNTSMLPDNAVISSAYVKMVVYDDFSTDDFNVTVQERRSPAPHNPLSVLDYWRNSFNDDRGHTNTSGYTDEDWFNVSLVAGGLADISKTGFTYWGLRSDQDISGSSPVNDEWIQFYGPIGVDPLKCPHLIINFTVPSSGWAHIVNLTFYNHSSGVPYNTTWVQSNGTVTVPAPMFNGVDDYVWNVSYNSNHTNSGDTQDYYFTTVTTGGASVSGGGGSSRVTSYLLIGLCFGSVGGALLWDKKKKRRKL
jgi:hypothetical protein